MKQNELKETISAKAEYLERVYREDGKYLSGSLDWQQGFVKGIKYMSKFVIDLLEGKGENKMTKEFNFKDFLAHKDFYELKDMMDTIQQELCFRENENYKNHVKDVLTAIQDLIDNGFGNKIATPNCNTWEELFTQIDEYY